MRQETVNIYTIDEHPNPEAVYDYIRNNWHDLGQHYIDEMVNSLRALAEAVNGKLDYAISIHPDRGEFVKITDYDQEALTALENTKNDCPLTGVCYDFTVIEGLMCDELQEQVLSQLHAEGEYIYSDEGLKEMCEDNEYEFYENGEIV